MTTENILREIEALVANQTFTAAALDGIQAIKKKLEATLEQLASAEKTSKDRLERCNDLVVENGRLSQRVTELLTEVESMRQAAAKGQEAIYNAQKHEAVAGAYKHALEVVFKPTMVREKVMHNQATYVPNGTGGGYPMQVQHQEEITRTHE